MQVFGVQWQLYFHSGPLKTTPGKVEAKQQKHLQVKQKQNNRNIQKLDRSHIRIKIAIIMNYFSDNRDKEKITITINANEDKNNIKI